MWRRPRPCRLTEPALCRSTGLSYRPFKIPAVYFGLVKSSSIFGLWKDKHVHYRSPFEKRDLKKGQKWNGGGGGCHIFPHYSRMRKHLPCPLRAHRLDISLSILTLAGNLYLPSFCHEMIEFKTNSSNLPGLEITLRSVKTLLSSWMPCVFLSVRRETFLNPLRVSWYEAVNLFKMFRGSFLNSAIAKSLTIPKALWPCVGFHNRPGFRGEGIDVGQLKVPVRRPWVQISVDVRTNKLGSRKGCLNSLSSSEIVFPNSDSAAGKHRLNSYLTDWLFFLPKFKTNSGLNGTVL